MAGGVPGKNSRRCSLATETTPERPLLVIQVSRRPTSCSVSRPPASSPLLAECTNMVALPGAAEAVAGTTASNPVATATSPTTLHENATPKAGDVTE